MIDKLIMICLVLGICAWVVHLIFMLQSLRSKKRWSLVIDYNTLHEGIPELILIVLVIIFNIWILAKVL